MGGSWGQRIQRNLLGRSMTTNFMGGLRRRNNELNELTNCRAARLRGIAPEGGSYSRIGARPYLPPVLSDSRCCPCKGRISWAGLAPQQDSRYEPLTGARFINRPQKVGASPYPKYEPLTGAMLSPQPSPPSLCKQSELQCYRPNHRRERPERAASPLPRATPWVPCPHSLRPVRAKVKANRSPILLPLQGEGVYALIPRALPWALN